MHCNTSLTLSNARSRPCNRGAFTIVELLVVIGIIAMLVGLLIVGINAAQKRAQRVNTQFLMSSLTQALGRFKSDHGYYPPVLGYPATLTDGQLGWSRLSNTPATQVGYMRDMLLPPTNSPVTGQTTKVGQWSPEEAKALQNWNSITTLPEYLVGAGDRSADGYGICGELPDPMPTDLLVGQRELPRAGIRSPGMDGVWGAAIQPLTMADASGANAISSYSGAQMPSTGNTAIAMKGLYFSRNLALPSRVTITSATASTTGNDTSKCILRSRPNLEGKIFGPYLELKDPSILAGVKGFKTNGDLDIVRVTDGDADFDKYPKVILDFWGQPIRYYRRGYVNLTPNTPDQATDGTKFDLGDFFVLRPTKGNESEFVPNDLAKTDVLDDANPDLQLNTQFNGKDRSSTARLRMAEFALISSGPDKKMDRTRRIALSGPNKDVDVNADNIVETGP